MVNLKKWEIIEHKDVREGDLLKIIEVIHVVEGASTVNVHKGMVEQLWPNGDFDLSDGTEWEDSDPTPYNQTVTCYRRKVKPFALPTGLGAVVEATKVSSGTKERFVLADPEDKGASWISNCGWYMPEDITSALYRNPVVLSKGVKSWA